ncbi:MAG: hypothetical protein EON49_06005 [Acidovorax sp.]|nr:MAG: hypothetical protein EON49_06005 [Acidovorax sp.]
MSLVCLMPIWYYLASYFAAPVFYIAGSVFETLFHWVQGYERQEASGVLMTALKVASHHEGQLKVGRLAPAVDYRMVGYGIVIFWAVSLASYAKGGFGRLLLGSLAMLLIQAASVCLQWFNDIANRAGPEVLAQSRIPQWLADAAAFGYHFNLFIFTALAPVMLWLLMNRAFLDKLWTDMRRPQPHGDASPTQETVGAAIDGPHSMKVDGDQRP